MFFCFKQKTADEMRISDWSSDVCSSDLRKSGCERSAANQRKNQFCIGSKEAAMGMLMLPFPMIVLGMIMSMRLCGHGFGHARCWPVLHAYVGQGLTDIRFGCFGSAEFNANSPGGAGLGFDNSRQMSKQVGDRACLAGVGQSFTRPMDMLIFFGEGRAGASGDFANALERQAIRVIMDAQLCGPVTPGGDDVRVLNALPPSQLSGKSGYAEISLIADSRKVARNGER